MIVDYFKVELAQSQQLAIALEQTAEVLTLQRTEICPIPGVKPELVGVSNQRGKLLWVMDLSAMLQLPPLNPRLSRQEKVTAIVLTTENYRIAGIVANLKGIISLDSDSFAPHPHPCLLAQTVFEESVLTILDVDSIFDSLQIAESARSTTVSSSSLSLSA